MKNADLPAMPLGNNSNRQPYDGLTKREMMAMHLMQGVMVELSPPGIDWGVSLAVRAADALLAELERASCPKN